MVDQAEIHRKVASGDVKERRDGAKQLNSNFADLSDKDEAWEDLIWLTGNDDSSVRWHAAGALSSAFQHVPDKCDAWKDLIRLTGDDDGNVRLRAAESFGSAFQHVPDKYAAWKDMIRLTGDDDRNVRWHAAGALGSAFQHVPDKYEAWKDLHRLTGDNDSNIRWHAAGALGSAFQYVPDEYEAWEDLHWLTGDDDSFVRSRTADVLGTAFQHVPDKYEAWKDLHRLTGDDDRNVRAYANHSLGRVSIFRASGAESEESFRKKMKNALEFFERSSKEAIYFNPSSFCLPFYRLFYTLMFEKEGAENEVKRYLAEAKSASKGSKNKEALLEAVENLANALSEAHKVTGFDVMKSNLRTYRQYCDSAVDLIGDAEGRAPSAVRVLRHRMPIIDELKKAITREIQEKAKAVCRETRGTPLEELGLATAKSAQELPTQDPLALILDLNNMASSATKNWCEYLPTDKKVDACEQLKNLANMDILEQGEVIATVFEYVQENIHIPKIQTVHISETEHEIVRIALAQFCFEMTETFPFVLKNIDVVKTKIFSALDIAKQNGANIICLPELCLYEEWIDEIKGKYPDMIVIGGSFYEDNKNICPIIMESCTDIPYQPKITPSPFEDGIMGPRMTPGDRIYRYETRFGKFVILICMDFDDLAHFFRNTDIDMIFCPSLNSSNERFHNEAHSHVERTPSYILIANTGLHGGTSIFGQLNNKYFGGLVDGGCKKRDDLTYKLCEVEAGQEEVIIADFNLDQKGAQVPIPSNPNKVIKSVDSIKKIPIQLN